MQIGLLSVAAVHESERTGDEKIILDAKAGNVQDANGPDVLA